MKIMIISPKNKTVFNFRGDLIKAMIAAGHSVVVTGPNQDYIDDIMSLGVSKFIEVTLVKDNTNILGDLNYYKKLVKAMKAEKPELVFSYTIKPVIYGSIAARRAGIKRVYPMITGLGRVYTSNSLKTKVIRMITDLLYRFAFKDISKVMFQNTDDMQQFVKAGYIPKSKAVHINGSGVNMERFKYKGLSENHVFLMTGRIMKEKGVLEYCKAAEFVKKIHPEASFVLLGGFDKSIGAIKPCDIAPYIEAGIIEFPGEQKDVVPYIDKCRYFVLPTYYREGVPRTILEAMAMGRPVITTDWPGCRDAVIDGETGFLVEPKNTEQLAEKMCELIKNQDVVRKMSANALTRCMEVYAVNIVNESMFRYMEL